MRYLVLVTMFLGVFGCDPVLDYDRPASYDYRYTIPFQKGETLTAWEPLEGSVELHRGIHIPLLAPGHVTVLDAFQGEVVLADVEFETMMVIEGIDDLEVKIGDELCAGDHMGSTRQVRIKAYWGIDADPHMRDLSIVRVVRNSTLTDLTDMRLADQVRSLLTNPGQEPKRNEFYWGDCPFGGE